ncbi:hypothetical protein [Geitlerinema sp. PCC 9228]|jgi:hypothetical protein|uniref:hypothetical protein n=1 Tax=Geitlerinema sp. PCC 9228 TaxID=111611 RepID=UPI0008F9CE7B|nr:hypothetical protein [Geitlerinema sp. PCC 9228]
MSKKTGTLTKAIRYFFSLLVLFAATGGLGTTLVVAVGGGWIGYKLIVNPQAFLWIDQYLPPANRIYTGQNPPLTLSQIQQQIRASDRLAGSPLPLCSQSQCNLAIAQNIAGTHQNQNLQAILLPVLKKKANCDANCKVIEELRIYQPIQAPQWQFPGLDPSQLFRLVEQKTVTGPPESFVIAPVANRNIAGSNTPVPLTQWHRFPNDAPQDGIWIHLSGMRAVNNTSIVYGQVLHYNIKHNHVSKLLDWTSPSGQTPSWKQVTGTQTPELVIDQSIGLEPKFQLYQVKPRSFFLNPVQLVPVSFTEPVLDRPTYQDALRLARSGLWSQAAEQFRQAKQQTLANENYWPNEAQAQLDLAVMHAEIAQRQAEAAWISPSQEVLAKLIDGRWESALGVFQTSWRHQQAIAKLLQDEYDRLWQRVETALRVHPQQRSAQVWAALMVGSRQGTAAAWDWLEQQEQVDARTRVFIGKLLRQLEAALAQRPLQRSHQSHIIGTAEFLERPNKENWWQPAGRLSQKIAEERSWYRIQVTSWHNGSQWQPEISSDVFLPSLWQQLGLTIDPQLQVTSWRPNGDRETISVTVKALRHQGNDVQLLATGPSLSVANSRGALAFTQQALTWVDSRVMTLKSLAAEKPVTVQNLLPQLWRELQLLRFSISQPIPSIPKLRSQFGNWTIESIDLNGNGDSEILLTLQIQDSREGNWQSVRLNTLDTNPWQTHTLIFSQDGNLLYNEFRSLEKRSLFGAIQIGEEQPPALLFATPSGYKAIAWQG